MKLDLFQDLLQCLKHKVDAVTLLRNSVLEGDNVWLPRVDEGLEDPVIPKLPSLMLQEQKEPQVEAVMLGHNSEEGIHLIAPFLKDPSLFVNFTAKMPPLMFKQSQKIPLQLKLLKLLKQ